MRFISLCLNTYVLFKELHDIPLYFEYDQLMSVVKCPVPKFLTMRSAICNAGYRCSIAHSNPKALKTDAPISFIWDICREWVCLYNMLMLRYNP